MKSYSPSAMGRFIERITNILPKRLARSVRWRYFKWAPKEAATGLDLTAIGFRWRLHPADNLTERLLWLHRTHPEEESLRWVLTTLRGKSALIIDVGANCGAFTIPMTAAAHRSSRTIAFEPNPVMLERLRTNLHLNNLESRVEVHAVALGSHAGEATLSFSRNMGQATLRTGEHKDDNQVIVTVRPLSDYLSDAARYEVILLKIDVEGYEPEVLVPFFSATDPALWPTHILIETEHDDDWSSDLSTQLAERGYQTAGAQDGNTFFQRVRQTEAT